MRYRTKVLGGLVSLAVVTNGVLLVLTYNSARRSLLDEMGSNVLSIATTAAATIDVDRYQQIKGRADEESPAYRDIERYLRVVRDANRRTDLRVRYIYTIARNANNPKAAHFVVDAEEEGDDKSRYGEAYKAADAAQLNFEAAQVTPGFVEDQWGVWLSGMAPIRDRAGRSLGLVGVDVDAADALKRLRVLLWSGLVAMACSVALAVGLAIAVSRRASKPLAVVCQAVRSVGQGNLDTTVAWRSNDEFSELASALNEMVVGLKQRETLKNTVDRYVSREVADEILASGRTAELRSERRKVTVLFADVRGFTTLSESMNPEEVSGFLNEYFDKMIDAIFRYKGTLNKFLGDGLMAMFGAPADDPYQEEHAIRAALEMQQRVRELRETFRQRRGVDFRIGIGINTGVAVVGNIGCTQRMEYTAIGDTVNTASRLEANTKELGADILVSEYTQVAVRNQFRFGEGQVLQVKGKADRIQVFPVEGPTEAAPVA